MKTRYAVLIGVVFIVVGMILLSSILKSQQNNQVVAPLSASTSVAKAHIIQSNYIQGMPSELILPSLNLDISVIPGVYNTRTKEWTLSLDKVQYAVMTPPPNNEEGNTFIYGHYRPGVFATLHAIQVGAPAVVKTTNGHSFYYQLASIRTTNPSDTSIFSYQGKPIMTIQTCTGLFFQNRQLFTFNLVRVV